MHNARANVTHVRHRVRQFVTHQAVDSKGLCGMCATLAYMCAPAPAGACVRTRAQACACTRICASHASHGALARVCRRTRRRT